jgi:hypothetical protein
MARSHRRNRPGRGHNDRRTTPARGIPAHTSLATPSASTSRRHSPSCAVPALSPHQAARPIGIVSLATVASKPIPHSIVSSVRMRGHQPTMDYVRRRTVEGKGKSESEIIRCSKCYVACYQITHWSPNNWLARDLREPQRDQHASEMSNEVPSVVPESSLSTSRLRGGLSMVSGKQGIRCSRYRPR